MHTFIAKEWLKRKQNKYTSHEIQNQLLKIMAEHVLRTVADRLQRSPFITVMIDKTTDVSNQEQVTVVMRRGDEDMELHEECLGLYWVASIDADSLAAVIKDTMTRFNLSMSRLRGQCYNECSTMSGARSGVAKRTADLEPRALITHYYGHPLNLAASDTVKNSKVMRNALETTHEITKLIKFSTRREADLKAESDEAAGISVLGGQFVLTILSNYTVLLSIALEATRVKQEYERCASSNVDI